MNKPVLNITIQTEDRGVIWDGTAKAISSINSQGPFDILPHHANFITIIKNTAVRIHQGGQPKVLDFQQAVLYVKEGRVQIYALDA